MKRFIGLLALGLVIWMGCGDLNTEPESDGPKVEILAPADSSSFVYRQVVTFIGLGIDEDGDTLTGNALNWLSDKDGLLGTGNSCSAGSLSVNHHVITLMVTDADSNIALTKIALTILVDSTDLGGRHPVAEILKPVSKSVYMEGDSVVFLGKGTAIDGSALNGDNLRWISDQDGQIGTDTGFTAWWLSANKHQITLLVTENDTDIAIDNIELTITPDTGKTVLQTTATISAPVNNSTFSETDTITFIGRGIDSEGTRLSGARLVWLSDKDGELGTDSTLTVTGLSVNTHKITLMVTDADDNIAVKSITITITGISGSAPTAVFTVTPDTGTVQTAFCVDASGVTDPQDDAADLQVRWDWENTGTFSTWTKTKTADHSYTSIGQKTIVMEVKDTDGMTDSYITSIYVRNTAPVADFQVVPGKGDTATSFQVDAGDCYDLEDQTTSLEVRWDWDGDGLWDTFWSTTKTGAAQYDTIGTKTIILEVRDTGRLTDLDTVVVEVE